RLDRGEGFPQRYAYAGRQLREEMLREIRTPEGDLQAALTRNAYGAVVLNAAHAFFVDVDLPDAPSPRSPSSAQASPSFFGWIMQTLFGISPAGDAKAPSASQSGQTAELRREQWLAAHRDWGMRVYRTRSGFRYLVTHALFEPGGAATEAAMQALGC